MSDYFDLHCHILFGVDDGAESMEQSLAMLRMEYEAGVRTVYLTPHYRKNMFECPPELRMEHFEQLRACAVRQLPGLELRLGCEFHVHMEMEYEIRGGKGFTMGDSSFVLLEFPPAAEKRYLIDRCRALMRSGYSPIIAHAERCSAIRKDLGLLKTLVDMGVYVQMNAGSITGEDGLAWKWFCRRAMERDLLHFIGSDAHNLKQFKPNLDKCARYLEKTMGREYRDQIMSKNPREILEGSV